MFETVKLPPGMLLIPGVIDSTSNYVEHPELVAERIVRYAELVGPENVLAGTDCGFGTGAGRGWVAPERCPGQAPRPDSGRGHRLPSAVLG